jgi:hypothetical protein
MPILIRRLELTILNRSFARSYLLSITVFLCLRLLNVRPFDCAGVNLGVTEILYWDYDPWQILRYFNFLLFVTTLFRINKNNVMSHDSRLIN